MLKDKLWIGEGAERRIEKTSQDLARGTIISRHRIPLDSKGFLDMLTSGQFTFVIYSIARPSVKVRIPPFPICCLISIYLV